MPLQHNQILNVQHISLDLTQLQALPILNDSYIEWESVADVINSTQAKVKPRGYQGSVVAISDNSYVMYGGALSDPFLNYNPQSYTWRTLEVDSNVNITYRNTVVNMGDDMFWLWGGENFPNFNNYVSNAANIYDYKAAKWVNQIVENDVSMRVEHTATLGLDGGIYILGGATRYPDGSFNYSNFNDVMRFDTKSSQWSYFTANSYPATPRVSHTATQLPNRNQILVYGGLNSDRNLKPVPSFDYYIIFDYSSKTFEPFQVSNLPNVKNSRYGHFATIYNETYLVMAHGFIDENTTATTLSVLDISDPSHPSWVASFSDPPTSTNSRFRDEYIVAIVVPIVVVVGIAVAIYFYKKREKKYKIPKDPFVIDDSDPRINSKETVFDSNENIEYAKLTVNDEKTGYNKINDNHPADAFCKPLGNTTDMADQNIEYIKPTEN
ncbi:hypothetical protein BJ944DRAFT_243311 [Cunninghamella echinulata]|nr:hypothetical protein BJ944DRAFT_243311 [Cunninghamella echinulata]